MFNKLKNILMFLLYGISTIFDISILLIGSTKLFNIEKIMKIYNFISNYLLYLIIISIFFFFFFFILFF